MDFLISLFIYNVFNLFYPQKQNNRNDMEDGAAYFFGTADMQGNSNCTNGSKETRFDYDSQRVNEEYDTGPDW